MRYYQDGPPSDININTWSLEIKTDTGENLGSYKYKDLLDFKHFQEVRRYVCVCNWSIKRNWQGFLLNDILQQVGICCSDKSLFLKQISLGTSDKGKYDSTIPLSDAVNRRAMIITGVDGASLTLDQGFPIRLMDFGLHGYKGVKCLKELIITTDFSVGYWEEKFGYDKQGFISMKKYWFVDTRKHKFISTNEEEVKDY